MNTGAAAGQTSGSNGTGKPLRGPTLTRDIIISAYQKYRDSDTGVPIPAATRSAPQHGPVKSFPRRWNVPADTSTRMPAFLVTRIISCRNKQLSE